MESRHEKTNITLAIIALSAWTIRTLWQKAHQIAWSVFGMGWAIYWAGGGLF
jgi:hypothetical protein